MKSSLCLTTRTVCTITQLSVCSQKGKIYSQEIIVIIYFWNAMSLMCVEF